MSPLTEPTRLTLAKGQPVPNDPSFAFNSLLLHGNGTNGSTVITDSSGSPKTVTAVGNAQISTAQSKFGGSSILFDGSGDWLTIPDSDAFSFGSGNFTIEAWIYNNTTGAFRHIVGQGNGNGTVAAFYFFKSNTNKLSGLIGSSGGSTTVTSSADLPLNTWTHVAFVRNGGTITLYINGVADGTASVTGIVVNDLSNQVRVGAAGEFPTDTWAGYIDELRITKGVARYTSNFTPPTAPFPDF